MKNPFYGVDEGKEDYTVEIYGYSENGIITITGQKVTKTLETLRRERDKWAQLARLKTDLCGRTVKRAEKAEREYQRELKRITITTQQENRNV